MCMCITRQWRAGSWTRTSFQQGVPPHLLTFLPHYLLQTEKPWNVWCTFTISVYDVHLPSQSVMYIHHHGVWCTFTITECDVHSPYIYHHSVWCTFTITVYDVHLQSQCPTLVMHTDDDRNQQQIKWHKQPSQQYWSDSNHLCILGVSTVPHGGKVKSLWGGTRSLAWNPL